MLEFIQTHVIEIVSAALGGVSITTVLGLVIYVVTNIRKLHKQNKLTKEMVQDAFTNAVLPRNIKLDVSNKISKPIEEGFHKVEVNMSDRIEQVELAEKYILMILSQFSHIDKLDDKIKQEILDYIDDSSTVDVEV